MPTDQILTVLNGDCRSELKKLAPESVHCCVTSPPYWGLRSYLHKNHPDKAREIGSEATPEAFVETMVQVFREVRRVLHDSGTLWLNLGDSYFGGGRVGNPPESKYRKQASNSGSLVEPNEIPSGCKPKDLCMIPWRVALALQADGWWLRSVIVWHKRSCMPESVTDRATNSWEPIFLLAKSQKYYYDAEAVKEPNEGSLPYGDKRNFKMNDDQAQGKHGKGMFSGGSREEYIAKYYTNGRNQRNVWSLGPEPYSEAHFATFPTEIPKRAILAGTSAKGCCPKCYAPWQRVVEKTDTPDASAKGSRFDKGKTADRDGGDRTQQGDRYLNHTLCWQPGCKCDGVDRRLVQSPTGERSGDDPSLVTGRAGMNRARGDNEGQRPITRYEQAQYAAQLKASPHRQEMEAEAGKSFAHYLRTDDSGARPIPENLLERWIGRGWVERITVPKHSALLQPIPCTVLDPFGGSGTTGQVAIELGRRAVLVELNPDYVDLISDRCTTTRGFPFAV